MEIQPALPRLDGALKATGMMIAAAIIASSSTTITIPVIFSLFFIDPILFLQVRTVKLQITIE